MTSFSSRADGLDERGGAAPTHERAVVGPTPPPRPKPQVQEEVQVQERVHVQEKLQVRSESRSVSGLVVVLATGGTIAGQAGDAARALHYTSASRGVDDLLAAVPALARFALQAEQVAQVDSKDMTLAILARLAARAAHHLARPEVAGVVITHGTDTLEETAWLLYRVLRPAKPVVLTAAMRPANAMAADGPLNLHDAVAVAADADSPPGVWLAFGSRILHGASVRKVHSWRLDAFDGGGQPDAGEVCEGRVRWWTSHAPSHALEARPAAAAALADPAESTPELDVVLKARRVAGSPGAPSWQALPQRDEDWPWVEIVASHAGASGRAIDALVKAGVQGLVVAATGNGSWHESLRPALQRAREAGVALLRATRCAAGGIEGEDRDDLVPSAGHLTPAQARVELVLRVLDRHTRSDGSRPMP